MKILSISAFVAVFAGSWYFVENLEGAAIFIAVCLINFIEGYLKGLKNKF